MYWWQAVDWQSTIEAVGIIVTISIFIVAQRRSNQLQRMEIYQNLEVASMEVFRFEAANAAQLSRFRILKKPKVGKQDKENENHDHVIFENYIYQCLNLFELAARYRAKKMMSTEVYGSWAAWHYDILCMWYFRELWPSIRLNYTEDIQKIFDKPVEGFTLKKAAKVREKAFYKHMADVFNCADIRKLI